METYHLKPPQRFKFSKEERICRKNDFSKVFDQGKRYEHPLCSLILLETSGTNLKRLGIIVSRKLGNAVRRNQIKRLLREIFRLNKQRLNTTADMVFIPKAGIGKLTYWQFEEIVFQLWETAHIFHNAGN